MSAVTASSVGGRRARAESSLYKDGMDGAGQGLRSISMVESEGVWDGKLGPRGESTSA